MGATADEISQFFIVTNLKWRAKKVVRFYNRRGTAEQWLKEGKNAVKWTKLSCRRFKDKTHAKYVVFQLAEVAVPRPLFAAILGRIGRLRLKRASG
jgi:hypothetical protein